MCTGLKREAEIVGKKEKNGKRVASEKETERGGIERDLISLKLMRVEWDWFVELSVGGGREERKEYTRKKIVQ